MAPQTELDRHNGATQAPQMTDVAPIQPTTYREAPASRDLTPAERQSIAMSWVGIALATILFLGGLALWAAVAFNAGFGGWLLGMCLLALVMVAVVVGVANVVIRPRR